LKVGSNNNTVIKATMIFLCTGSKPFVPPIKGLHSIRYHTSGTILAMDKLPESIAIVGGGYIAAEYGHFFSSMGSKVTIVGRNKQFLHREEPEISALSKRELEKHMEIITNNEVIEVSEEVTDSSNNKKGKMKGNKKSLTIEDKSTGERKAITAQEVLIALQEEVLT
jgi:mycothione reductase